MNQLRDGLSLNDTNLRISKDLISLCGFHADNDAAAIRASS